MRDTGELGGQGQTRPGRGRAGRTKQLGVSQGCTNAPGEEVHMHAGCRKDKRHEHQRSPALRVPARELAHRFQTQFANEGEPNESVPEEK